MACYVDDMRAPLGRMQMCHMIADSHEELCAMAMQIGVARRWLQHEGTYQEHFDLSISRRERAVRAGAIEITTRELARKCIARRTGAELEALERRRYAPLGSSDELTPDPPAEEDDTTDQREAC